MEQIQDDKIIASVQEPFLLSSPSLITCALAGQSWVGWKPRVESWVCQRPLVLRRGGISGEQQQLCVQPTPKAIGLLCVCHLKSSRLILSVSCHQGVELFLWIRACGSMDVHEWEITSLRCTSGRRPPQESSLDWSTKDTSQLLIPVGLCGWK